VSRPAPTPGLRVTHRRYLSSHDAHYGGGLVDGAGVLRLFGEAATELSIRTDGDEGLLASYDDVQFLAPVRAGDVVQVVATLDRVGRRSRHVTFTCHVVSRAAPQVSASAATVLEPPLLAVTALGTVVAPM
jgi:3-aminobutyryl-CoA ammonia-lyase